MVILKNKNKILFIIAIVVIVLASINLAVTFYKTGWVQKLTGHATDIGTANLTIVSQATITFTTESINWGTGRVNESAGSAYLDSEGYVVNGNWTKVSQGLTLRNDGNCNVLLNFTTSNTADGFIGGTAPNYRIKVTANESSSCTAGLASSYAVATGASQAGCSNFTYYDAQDLLDIDVNLTIPQDALPGAKGSTITATATVID